MGKEDREGHVGWLIAALPDPAPFFNSFAPRPADESPRRPTAEVPRVSATPARLIDSPFAEAHPQESRTKGQLKEEACFSHRISATIAASSLRKAVRLKSQLDALTAGLEVSASRLHLYNAESLREPPA